MKKIVSILLCGVMTLTLAGCKKGSSTISPAASSSKSGTTYKQPSGNGGGVAITDPAASVPSVTNATSEVASDYEIEDDLGGVDIVRYHGKGGKVTVPQTINKQKVIKIDEHAFRGSEVTNVTIPGTVREIETHAFSGCDKLETLTIAEGVEVIDGYAFSNCERLCLVTLPDSIREINAGAFDYCPNLQLTFKGKTYTAVDLEELYEYF